MLEWPFLPALQFIYFGARLMENYRNLVLYYYDVNIIERVSRKKYKQACGPIEDSDQPSRLHSLIRVFDGTLRISQGFNDS